MSWKVHPDHFLRQHQSARLQTIPEAPGTIHHQMNQLNAGKRKLVMIPRGTAMPRKIPKHLHTIRVPKVGNFIFHPHKIKPGEIRKAVRHNKLPEILGAADGGMGAPDKTQLSGTPEAVVGKDAEGVTTQGTLTDQENLPEALAQTAKLTPEDGSLEVVPPEQELADRMAWQVSPEDFLKGLEA